MRISTPRSGPLTPTRRPCSATTATTTARQPIEASWPAVAAPARSRTRGQRHREAQARPEGHDRGRRQREPERGESAGADDRGDDLQVEDDRDRKQRCPRPAKPAVGEVDQRRERDPPQDVEDVHRLVDPARRGTGIGEAVAVPGEEQRQRPQQQVDRPAGDHERDRHGRRRVERAPRPGRGLVRAAHTSRRGIVSSQLALEERRAVEPVTPQPDVHVEVRLRAREAARRLDLDVDPALLVAEPVDDLVVHPGIAPDRRRGRSSRAARRCRASSGRRAGPASPNSLGSRP